MRVPANTQLPAAGLSRYLDLQLDPTGPACSPKVVRYKCACLHDCKDLLSPAGTPGLHAGNQRLHLSFAPKCISHFHFMVSRGCSSGRPKLSSSARLMSRKVGTDTELDRLASRADSLTGSARCTMSFAVILLAAAARAQPGGDAAMTF